MKNVKKRIVLLIIDGSFDCADAMMNVQKGNEAARESDRPIKRKERWNLKMKKMKRTLTMILVMTMFFAIAFPAGRAYADEDNTEEVIEEVVEEVVKEPEQTEQNENTLTIVYDVVETKSKGSLYGEMPTVVGGEEEQVSDAEDVTIRDLDAHSYQTFTGNEKDRFAYVSYAFKGWMTEDGEILTPGSDVAAESLDADGDGVAVLSSAWSGSWKSGSGTPFAKFSLWTNAMSANDCIENGTLLGENLSGYTPSVGGSIMVALDDEGNTITPDELASPSHGNKGKNIGDIYNNPELNFKENNQGKYMMISYMGSSVSQADEDIRALASTGIHTNDSESGDVTWKLDNLPTDEEVLSKVSSFVSRGMTTMRDENGQRIAAEDLTTENYQVRWCQVKYQSGSNDGWNINGVLSTRLKELRDAVAEIVETIIPGSAETTETEVTETETTETEVTETETTETGITENEVAETETAKPVKNAPKAKNIRAPRTEKAPASVTETAEESEVAVTEIEDDRLVPLAAHAVAGTEEILDDVVPLSAPTGSWALVNLICLAISLYILLPLFGLKAKFARPFELSGRDELNGEEKSFLRRFSLGLSVEILAVILSAAVFMLTQDLTARMALIDGYTGLMAALTAVCAAIEPAVRAARRSETAKA